MHVHVRSFTPLYTLVDAGGWAPFMPIHGYSAWASYGWKLMRYCVEHLTAEWVRCLLVLHWFKWRYSPTTC